MKIRKSALRNLIKEAVEGDRIVKERPWSVEHSFRLSGGTAEDSEGKGPDGFAVVLRGESGNEMRVVVDTYWNPQSGDSSGNSLRVEVNGEVVEGGETYVPTRFDDGKQQFLIVSNSPTAGVVCVSHKSTEGSVPVVYLAIANPFEEEEDVEFEVENIGNGEADVKLTNHVNL
jgi:hypothetical protein